MKDILPLSSDDFALFQELLIEMCGLHFEEGRNQSLHLALWQRLQQRGYDSYREYYNLLKFHPEGRLEIRELLDLITIGETYFFRTRGQFNVLMRFVLPKIIQRKLSLRDKSLRFWSAGCSRGDEAYSIAIAVMEVLSSYKEWHISILGTDINRNGLACAKEAIYGEKDVAHLPKEYLDKYFKTRGSTYLLNSEVREIVQFGYHNLVKDPFIHEGMQNIDIIFCRNVTIYLDCQTIRRVIENFYNCLAQEGYLFLGHTETLWQITNKFERVEFPQTFIYKKRLSPGQEGAVKPFMAVPEINIEDLTHSMAPRRPFLRQARDTEFIGVHGQPLPAAGGLNEPLASGREAEGLTSIKKTSAKKSFSLQELRPRSLEKPEPLRQIEKPPCQTPRFSPDPTAAQDKNDLLTSLSHATILANEAKYKEAADILSKVIEADNLSVEAYYLLAVLSYKSGNLREAEAQFRKVIYVDPDSVLAYFNLGNIYRYQGKFREAAREFRNAIRLSEKRPKDEQIRFCEDFTVEFLLRACRNNLLEISKRGERYE
jgi:chemotaxis protein methyltransferase CheR